jgi:hypothetical protein
VDKNSQAQLLTLMKLVRSRFERDLIWLAQFTREHEEFSFREILHELNQLHSNYLRLEAVISAHLKSTTEVRSTGMR